MSSVKSTIYYDEPVSVYEVIDGKLKTTIRHSGHSAGKGIYAIPTRSTYKPTIGELKSMLGDFSL